MTAFHIKLIAIITMLIDHIGYFFFPDIVWFRIIGRLAFPLFAWLIANGAYHTKNINAYFLRLFVFALLSQIPFFYANRLVDPAFDTLNIFFTLSIGLGAILLMKQTKNQILWLLIAFCSAIFALILKTDYGAFGVLLIISAHLFFQNWKYLLISQAIIIVSEAMYMLLNHNAIGIIEITGIFSLLFVYFYNKKEGPKFKQLFYLIYPLQYVVVYLVMKLL